MYVFYTLLYSLGLLLYAPRALLRRRKLTALRQRLGRAPSELSDIRGAIWIHAVSVGEVHAARALMPRLRERFPERPIALSTTTRTGQELARTTSADAVFYMPLDLPAAIRPFLESLRPSALLLVETEIWPQLIRSCRRHAIPVVLVNARLSERSCRRYRLLARFWAEPLEALHAVCARTTEESERFASLGIDRARIWVTGNLKGEAEALRPPAAVSERLRATLGLDDEAPVLVAGCTMEGEDAMVLDAFETARASVPELRLLLAPRHPERFDAVAEQVRSRGLGLRRRSAGQDHDGRPEVLLLDTIGELPAAYALGTISFVGGSLVPTGGHNLLEPAVQRQPVIHGPHMDNFAAIERELARAGAAVRVLDAEQLAAAVVELCGDADRRRRMGARATEVVARDAGAADRTARRLRALLRGIS